MSRKKQKVLLEEYVIGEQKLKPGQCVMLRPPHKGTAPYLARIEQIEQQQVAGGSSPQAMLLCRWYYRPEESIGGRRLFHGAKEVFLSDHVDRCYAESVEGTCQVHSLRSYTALRTVGETDFFCRFQYNAKTGLLSPDRVAVYCTCEMPFNPDTRMLFCTRCQDLFHPECVGRKQKSCSSSKGSRNASNAVERFVCPGCEQTKLGSSTPAPEAARRGLERDEGKAVGRSGMT